MEAGGDFGSREYGRGYRAPRNHLDVMLRKGADKTEGLATREERLAGSGRWRTKREDSNNDTRSYQQDGP